MIPFLNRAVSQIPSGEEITISYMDPLQRRSFDTTQNRQKILREEFGFDCCCQVCLASSPQDDRLRQEILELENSTINATETIELLQHQLDLCLRVGMHPGITLPICLRLIAHCRQSNRLDIVRSVSSDAKKYSIVAYGTEDVITQKMEKICHSASYENDEELLETIDQLLNT